MVLDTATFVMSLSLDALLCCGISAALTRALPASSEALWNWSGAMLCFCATFALIEFAGWPGLRNPVLSGLLPHSFAVIGCSCVASACIAINGRRVPRWPAASAASFVSLIAASYLLPDAHALRLSGALIASGALLLCGAYAFANESRWRSVFCGWLAILSITSLAAECAAIGCLPHIEGAFSVAGLSPFLFFFEAAFLASSFAFILAAGDLARSQALDLSMRDGLTGLLTKRAFFEAAAPALSKALREGQRCSMLMIDIDHFKRVNDTYGHLAGDAALVHASGIILRALRSSDICARFGGEEFCALLPGTDSVGARQVASRIIDMTRDEPAIYAEEHSGTSHDIPFTISVGAHVAGLMCTDAAQALLAKADAALYCSKNSGRDRLTLTEG